MLKTQNKSRKDSNLPIETTIKAHREVAGESERITVAAKQAVNSFIVATVSPYLSELTLILRRLDSVIKKDMECVGLICIAVIKTVTKSNLGRKG